MVKEKPKFTKADAAELRARWSKSWKSEVFKITSLLTPEKEAVLLEHEPAAMLRWEEQSRIRLTEQQIEDAALRAPGQLLKLPGLIHRMKPEILKTCMLKAPKQGLCNRTARDHMGQHGAPSIEECVRMIKPREFNAVFAENPEVILGVVGTSSDQDWLQHLLKQTKAPWHKAVEKRILSRI